MDGTTNAGAAPPGMPAAVDVERVLRDSEPEIQRVVREVGAFLSEADRDELAQRLRIWLWRSGAARFDPARGVSMRTWIRGRAMWCRIDMHRARDRAESVESLDDEAGTIPNADHVVLVREVLDVLRDAPLDGDERAALLAFLSGEDGSEAAARRGVDKGTQSRDLATCIAWAARLLGLPPPRRAAAAAERRRTAVEVDPRQAQLFAQQVDESKRTNGTREVGT